MKCLSLVLIVKFLLAGLCFGGDAVESRRRVLVLVVYTFNMESPDKQETTHTLVVREDGSASLQNKGKGTVTGFVCSQKALREYLDRIAAVGVKPAEHPVPYSSSGPRRNGLRVTAEKFQFQVDEKRNKVWAEKFHAAALRFLAASGQKP